MEIVEEMFSDEQMTGMRSQFDKLIAVLKDVEHLDGNGDIARIVVTDALRGDFFCQGNLEAAAERAFAAQDALHNLRRALQLTIQI